MNLEFLQRAIGASSPSLGISLPAITRSFRIGPLLAVSSLERTAYLRAELYVASIKT